LHPHRSDAAARHDPPLVVRRFVTRVALCPGALLQEVGRRLAGTPASAERTLWHGGIHVNGRPLDAEALPASLPADAWIAVYAFEREPEPVAFEPSRVLYDGDGLVAVDKPAWLPMQRTRASARVSLEASLRAQLGDASLVAAHRLDRQTSGVALFARGRNGAWASRAFGERRVEKRYLAVTEALPAGDAFTVEGWIARALDRERFRFALHPDARPEARWSRTGFRVLRRGASRALVEARPETGRTHQIRVHLAAHGTPVAGDALYGTDPTEAAPRVLLHAASLALQLPSGAALRLEAEPPGDVAGAVG
jgi:23S rRNA pseudouridine1911/1915/1917 synthase